jgi:hypothetical protein
MISEDDPNTVALDRMPTVMGHFPAGTSLQNLEHWSQLLATSTFKKFDFGPQ